MSTDTVARLIESLRAGRFAEIPDMFPPNLRALVSARVLNEGIDVPEADVKMLK